MVWLWAKWNMRECKFGIQRRASAQAHSLVRVSSVSLIPTRVVCMASRRIQMDLRGVMFASHPRASLGWAT